MIRRLLTLTLFVIGSSSLPRLARADIPPTCDFFDGYFPCSSGEVGNACPSGGTCFEVQCLTPPPTASSKIYRCDACPTLVDADAGGDGGASCMSYSELGKPCGSNGTCARLPSHCQPGGLTCVGPKPVLPQYDGGAAEAGTEPGGDAGPEPPPVAPAEDDGGCSIAPRALRRSLPLLLSPALLAVGVASLLLDRRRRRGQ